MWDTSKGGREEFRGEFDIQFYSVFMMRVVSIVSCLEICSLLVQRFPKYSMKFRQGTGLPGQLHPRMEF